MTLVLGVYSGSCSELDITIGSPSQTQEAEVIADTQDLPPLLSVDTTTAPGEKIRPPSTTAPTAPPPPPTQAKAKKDLKIAGFYCVSQDATGFVAQIVQNKTWPKVVKWRIERPAGVRFAGPFIVLPNSNTAQSRATFTRVSEPTAVKYSAGGWRVTTGLTVSPKKK